MDRPEGSAEQQTAGRVSFRQGLSRCAGNEKLYERLLERFLTGCASMPDDIRRAGTERNLEEVAHIAHSAISSAGTIGATTLADAARRLQTAVEEAPADVEPLIEKFAEEHGLAMLEVRQYFADRASRGKA